MGNNIETEIIVQLLKRIKTLVEEIGKLTFENNQLKTKEKVFR